MLIEKATIEDLSEILLLQKITYKSEADLIDDYNIPPLRQTLEEFQEEFSYQTILKYVLNNEIIGSIRAYESDGTCFIGKIIVYPENQNMGIGSNLLKSIEYHFKNSKRYELFTGEKSEKNIYLYNKHGYKVFKKQKISNKLTHVFMQKDNIPAENKPKNLGRSEFSMA